MNRKEIYKLKALDTAVKVRNQGEYNRVIEKLKEYTGIDIAINDGVLNKNYPYITIYYKEAVFRKRVIGGSTNGECKDYIYETIEDFLENFEDKEEVTIGIRREKLLDVDFKVQKDNKTIVLDIIHMDESLRGNNDNKLLAKSKDGKYTIWSNAHPTIGFNRITLRGSMKEEDNTFTYCTFLSTEEMNKYIEEMNKLIDEINKGEIIVDFNGYNFENDKLININNNFKVVLEGSLEKNKALRILSNKNNEQAKNNSNKYNTCQGWVVSDEYDTLSFEEVKIQFEKFFKDRNLNVILK